MTMTKECCGWLGWAAMAGIDEHGRRMVEPDTTRSEDVASEHRHDQADGHCCDASELDCSLTINDVLARHPATGAVFNRFGVDLCCSASLTVEDAVLALGVNRHALCGALREAAAA